jgi:predicted dehydrogenase
VTAARIAIGVVGLGYWGPNLARNFAALPGAELSWLCEEREDVRERFGATFQQARTTRKLDDLLWDPALDAVVLATPVAGHAELSVRVLEAGKRRLVEKPPATR